MWYQPQYSNQMLMNTRPIVQLSNRWAWVKSYQDVQATPIPAGGTQNIAFSTLISVGNCPCNGRKSLNIVYTGSAGTLTIANVIVTKIR